jgi:hypothetical protein
MLRVDPAQRIGVEELQKEPLIATASDLAEGLPVVPPPKMREGEVVELQAIVCPDGFSFAGLCLAVPRRFSYHMGRRMNDPEAEFPRTKPGRGTGSHSDGEDEGALGGAVVTFGNVG